MRYKKLSPRDLKEQDKYMWDEAEFDLLVNLFIPNRSITHIFKKYLKLGDKILEGGCGNGSWVKYLSNSGYQCVGVDVNPEILKIADENNLNVKIDNIENLSFDKSHFDAYLSLGVVEHNEEGPTNAINEAFRVLKPGGYFFVSTPCNNLFRKLFNHPLRDLLNIYYRFKNVDLHFVEYRFERQELLNYVKDSGFKIIETIPNDYRLDCNEYSFGLYTDWPIFRNKKVKYKLNKLGMGLNYLLKKLSPYLAVSGMLIVAKKPG